MPRQYLLLVEEEFMNLINKLMPGIQFVQVEGMHIKDNEKYNLLVSPKVEQPAVKLEEVPVV